MTIEHRNLIAAMIALGAGAVVQLYAGVEAGLHDDWMRMSLFLFGSVFGIFVGTAAFVVMKLKDSLTRLEDRFQIGRQIVPKGVRRVQAAVGILIVL